MAGYFANLKDDLKSENCIFTVFGDENDAESRTNIIK